MSSFIPNSYCKQYELLEEEKTRLSFGVEEPKEEFMLFEEAWQIWQTGSCFLRELVRHLCFEAPISIERDKIFELLKNLSFSKMGG